MEDKEKQNVTLMELKKLESSSEKLAREIRMISRAFKKMSQGGLKRETLVLLLHDMSNVGKPDIRYVLNSLDKLEDTYLTKEGMAK
jgi:uncharacterized protein with von Willebrand factor type A (vWA) domain